MNYVSRTLSLESILDSKSCFLFGPRQTGKSALIRNTLAQYPFYNLLDSDTFLTLSQNPKWIEQSLTPDTQIIIIDEIQKLPQLLDEVHLMIEKYGIRFLMTGSSARKLRQGGVNLLGGRARSRTLHPLSYREIGSTFNLEQALAYGLIPSIYFSDSPIEDLHSYCGDYLREEISSEATVRNIPSFSRFLEVAALCNGQLINYTNISNDARVPQSTVQDYFQILKDTLIAFEVPAWKKTVKRKPIQTSKFYFFDVGVARHLQHRTTLAPKSPEFGAAFEHYFAHELKLWVDLSGIGTLHYWRSTSGFEVDFIVNETIAIEVKAKGHVSDQDLKGLRALREEGGGITEFVVVCLEHQARIVDGIRVLPWDLFLGELKA
jgi:predicted AAA+ superfamily ATPase